MKQYEWFQVMLVAVLSICATWIACAAYWVPPKLDTSTYFGILLLQVLLYFAGLIKILK